MKIHSTDLEIPRIYKKNILPFLKVRYVLENITFKKKVRLTIRMTICLLFTVQNWR